LFEEHALEKGFKFSESGLLENIKRKYLEKIKETQLYKSQCQLVKDCSTICEQSHL
jgi:ferredoxin